MASSLNYNDNGFRASKLLVDGGGYLTKQILLQNAIKGTIKTIDEFLAEENAKRTIKKLKFKKLIQKSDYTMIYPPNGQPTNLDHWDITLVTLILNNCVILPPAENIAIQEIRELRNTLYGHTAKVELTDTEFQQNWTNISSTLINHSKLLTNPSGTKSIQDLITTISTETLSAGKTIETLKNWYEWGMEVEDRIDELAKEQTVRFKEAETMSYERHRAMQDKLSDMVTLQKNATDELIIKLDKYYREQNVDKTELNKRIAQAKNILDAHQCDLEKYGFPYKTQMTEELTHKLTKNKILVLKGIQGSGKTHLAKNVLVNFLKLNPKLSPLTISSPNEIDKVLDPTGSFVLLVDDMIGTNSFNSIEYKDWCHYIETLMSQVAVGSLFVVITIRTSIYKQCQGKKLAKLFEDPNVSDVGEYLLEKEKVNIFEKFSKYHSIVVSPKQMKLIVQQKSAGIGFPLLCKMMKGHNVDQLFKSPIHYLKTEITRIKEDFPIGFVVLFMALVGDGMLSKTSPTKNQLSSFQTLQTFFKASQMDLVTLYQAAHMFEETFFNFNDTELKFSFIHETISQSIFEAALDFIPNVLIKYYQFDLFIRRLNLVGESSIPNIKKPDPYLVYKQYIMDRMVGVLSSNESSINIKSVASASIWNNKEFADEALRKFEMKYFYQEDNEGVSMICYFASLGLEYILKRIISKPKPVKKSKVHDQIIKALERACFEGKKVCVEYLISKVGQILPEHVFASVIGGNIDILKLIISQFGESNIDTLRQENTEKTLLHIAAEIGRIEIMIYLNKLWPKMLQRKDENEWNVCHSSAKSGKTECLKYILQNGVDGNEVTKFGETLLHVASEGGHIDTIKFVLERYPDMVKILDFSGRTVAHSAADGGSIECLQILIDKGIDPKQNDKDGTTILQVAAAAGNYNLLKYICDRYEELVQETDNEEYTILHYAAMTSGLECMQYLIEKYTDVHLNTTQENHPGSSVVNFQLNPNKTTRYGSTLLHISALHGHINTLTYICEIYPDLLQLTDKKGGNALYHAARKGTSECLKYLVEHGFNPRDKTEDGDTILHLAASGGNMNTMTYICETYPDLLHLLDTNGRNALYSAAYKGTIGCFKYLVEHGLNPRDITGNGETILHLVALGGNINIMTYICETYPNMLQLTDNDGRNALHDAARLGTVECLKYLVEHGLNPRDKARQGKTILQLAALSGNMKTMAYICEIYTGLLQLTDNDGNNALHDAASLGTVECLKYLVEHGLYPRDTTGNGKTILHFAALGGNINTMTYICETYPGLLQLTDKDGRNALHDAASLGTVECLKYIVEHGLNPRDITGNGETILHLAALSGNINTMTYICDTYPDLLQLTDNDDFNALHDAAYQGTFKCLKYLVEHGLNPRDKTGDGDTILHLAALSGNINKMTYICETYPDMLQFTGNNGRNALHNAAHGRNALHCAAIEGTVECLKYLVGHGFNPRHKTEDGDTILHLAALGMNMNTMTYICETYPDLLHLLNTNGRNALYNAAYKGTIGCFKYLVEHGLNPRDITGNGETILHLVALGGNINIMTYICETYPDLLQLTDNDGRNALHDAAMLGTVECLKYLVEHGLNPRDKARQGKTILQLAALSGNMKTMAYICEIYTGLLQLTDNDGNTALHDAARLGTVECLKYLVEHGLNPRDTTGNGKTILHLAVLGGNINTMTYICETYPDLLQLTDNDGRKTLHYAACSGNVECLKYLVGHGFNPRDKTEDGDTILHLAALGMNMNTMTYICETYPDLLHLLDTNGRNVLYNAAYKGTIGCFKYLVEHGLNPRDITGNGETILHLVALGGNINIMTYICETYTDLLQLTDNDGRNALHDAARLGTVECLKYLVEHGLNPRDITGNGETVLHLAALSGNINTMTYICETYPDLQKSTDNNGRNALYYAAQQGTIECLKCLVEHGLNPSDKIGKVETSLHQAALGGNINTLTFICETYPDLLQLNKRSQKQALRNAEQSGSDECYKYLIDLGLKQQNASKTCNLI